MHVRKAHDVRQDRGVLGSWPRALVAVVGVGPEGPLCLVWKAMPYLVAILCLVVALCLVAVLCLDVALCFVFSFVLCSPLFCVLLCTVTHCTCLCTIYRVAQQGIAY